MTAGQADKNASTAPTVAPPSSAAALLLAAIVAALVTAFALSLALGAEWIPPGEICGILFGGSPANSPDAFIVWQVRLPKACAAVLAGAALAAAGLMMQTLFSNPLAGPYVLGIDAGASLGVAILVLATGDWGESASKLQEMIGQFGRAAAATVGAAGALGVVLAFNRRVRDNVTLLIAGLMFGHVSTAIISILLHDSGSERIKAYIAWTAGGFGEVTITKLWVFAPAVTAGLLLAGCLVKPLNALLLGETYAHSLGVHVDRARLLLLASTAVLAGATTAFCGPIMFLGVAIPHLARALFRTADHRLLLPVSVLLGALLAVAADLLAHSVTPIFGLPLNAVMALLGAPIVVWVVMGQSVRRS